jgi:transglutaminase-like putative cysteine protease
VNDLVELLALTIVVLCLLMVAVQERLGSALYEGSKSIQMSFMVMNESSGVSSGLLRVYAPVQRTSHQNLADIESNYPFEVQKDEWGNTVLSFRLKDIAPYGRRHLRIRADLDVAERPQAFSLNDEDVFLNAEPYIETDHPRMQVAAGLSRRGDKESSLRAAYEWVIAQLERESYIEDDRGALWALRNGQGDCTQQMYLFVALARLHGVPARGVGGYVLSSGSRSVSPTDYHNWAEVYLDGAWHVVDPDKAVFMSDGDDYIAMRIIRPPDRSPLGDSHRYEYDGRGISVSME